MRRRHLGSRVLAGPLPAERLGCLHIEPTVAIARLDHHPIVAPGGLHRDVTRCDVLEDLLGRPFERVAEAAAATRFDGVAVSTVKGERVDLAGGKTLDR